MGRFFRKVQKNIKAADDLEAVKEAVKEPLKPQPVFKVAVIAMDNGQVVVEHPQPLPGQRQQLAAAVIDLLATGIKTMAQKHCQAEPSRIIRPT